MNKKVLWLVLFLLVYAAVEGISTFGLNQLSAGIAGGKYTYYPADTLSDNHRSVIERLLAQESNYTVYSPTLGWTIKPGGRTRIFHGKRQGDFQYRANSQGIRAEHDYSITPRDGIIRVATFGDSLTHCDDVPFEDTWQTNMTKISPTLEVINFGVGGFGLDQSFLRYRQDGIEFEPHIVLIGYMSENIRRNVNVFRGFYAPDGQMPLAKPRFLIANGRLALLPNPMSRLSDYRSLLDDPTATLTQMGKNDGIYSVRYRSGALDWSPTIRLAKLSKEKIVRRYIGDGIIDRNMYNTSSDAFRVTTMIFDSFYEESNVNNSIPIIILFPNQVDVRLYLKDGRRRYSPLIDYFETKGYRYVDLLDTLLAGAGKDYDVPDLFVGHYSPMANRIVARELVAYMSKAGFIKLTR